MKNLAKIFMAVVAGMFAFSCVTDATEDLGVKIEGQEGGVYEVTLSLEQSRTQLGEKVEGLYPLYWSEGDAIAINGINSLPLTGVAENAAEATFNFTKEVARPFCVVYPAPTVATVEDEVVEAPATIYPVTFAATQPYTVGSFAPQSAPMYGYAAAAAEGEEEAPVQLNHLTGVLNLAVRGNGEKITSIRVQSEKGAIAGPHTVDCTTGALTALEGASNVVTVTCGDGIVLEGDDVPFFVTVPAGKYGTFMITIFTENHGKMTVKFNSDASPINPGTVREFGTVYYEANLADENGEEFIIDSKEALIEFARIAGGFYPRTSAKVTAEIDMTGYDWKPIKYFGEYTFDGGNFAIKGLNAPLFDITAATIKNVKLTDVDMTITDRVHSGAIACVLYGSMDNCSASGKININNTTFAPEKITNQYEEVCHGGLVGMANGATVTNTTNDIDITITSLTASTVKIKSTVGGIVGGACAAAQFGHLTNNGDITYAATVQGQNVYISGVVGKTNTQFGNVPVAAMNDCTNNGKLSSTASSVCSGSLLFSGITGNLQLETEDVLAQNFLNTGTITHAGKAGGLSMAGCVCYLVDAKIYNWKNTADMTIKAGAESKDANVAGVITGDIHATSVDMCVNTGNVVVEKSTLAKVYLGGISSDVYYANSITNCSNSGNISVADATTATCVYVAGIAAQAVQTQKIENCTNSGNFSVGGGITCSDYIQVLGLFTSITARNNVDPVVTNLKNTGNLNIGAVTLTNTGNNGRIYMAGISGTIAAGTYTNCYNEGTITATPASMQKEPMIGGLFGYISYVKAIENQVIDIVDCENKAAITINPTAVKGGYIGGITGQAWSEKTDHTIKFTRTKNSGAINCGGAAWGSTTYVGGLWAHINNYSIVELDGCENSGNITFNPTEKVSVYVGGIAGNATNKQSILIKNSVNSAALNVSCVVGSVRFGGILATRESSGAVTISGCSNTGSVTLGGTQTSTGNNYAVGGILGYATTTLTKVENCINGSATDATKGLVTAGTAPGGIGLGGVVGMLNYDTEIVGCKNYGKVCQTGKGGNGNSNRVWLGGILGASLTNFAQVNNCENHGTVEYGTTASGGRLDIGGIVGGVVKKGRIIGCKNGGSVIFNASSGSEMGIGGIIGSPQEDTSIHNCENLATGVIWVKGTCSSNLGLGGVVGSANNTLIDITYCTNSGSVLQTKSNNGQNYIGGIIGYAYTWNKITHCTNAGPIETVGSSSGKRDYVGGIVGYARHLKAYSEISDCVNTYPLVFTGKAGTVRHGGLFGCTTNEIQTAEIVLKNLYNLADLTFKGQSTAAAGTAEALCCGGVTGVSRTSLDNAQFYGTITALGLEGYVGAICGNVRDVSTTDINAKAVNSKAGGYIVYSEATEEDANGDMVTYGVKTPIDLTMFYCAPIAASVAQEDGCSLLTKKPATPVYTYTPAE